jgi:hypothetical protein
MKKERKNRKNIEKALYKRKSLWYNSIRMALTRASDIGLLSMQCIHPPISESVAVQKYFLER